MRNANLHLVQTLDDALDFRNWLGERRDWCGFDIETGGLNVGREPIRLFQMGDTEVGWAIPYEDWRGFCVQSIQDYDRRLVAHNLLFDSKFLQRDGVDWRPKEHLLHDSMIMAHMDNPVLAIGLKPLSRRHFGAGATVGQSALETAKRKQGWTWETVPSDFPAYWAYGALDTVLTARIAEKLWPRIQGERFIYDIELAAIHVIREAELRGVKVDLGYARQTEAMLQRQMEEARPHIPEEVKNPGSDKQVIDYLERVGARLWKKTEKGHWSVSDDVLEQLEAQGIPGMQPLRQWRNAKWLINSYFSNILSMNVDGILRPSVKPVGAVTSRMSIVEPALQTIPRGTLVRDAFIARDGHSLISCDYDQLELRVLADAAQEEAMLAAIHRGEDMHNFVATSLYGPSFTKAQRQICKNGQFAIVYGAGVPQFARTAGISEEAAQQFMDSYAYMFPGVARFMETMINQARSEGYIRTKFGRRIPVNKDKAYVAVNYYCQPTATSDLIKLKLHDISAAGLGEFFRLPIHDEVILEVPDDIVLDVNQQLNEVMTETRRFSCPLTASGVVVKCWGDKWRLDEKEAPKYWAPGMAQPALEAA